MPVQIDEVVITTTVNEQRSGVSDAAESAPDPIETQRELAEKILQIIREKSER